MAFIVLGTPSTLNGHTINSPCHEPRQRVFPWIFADLRWPVVAELLFDSPIRPLALAHAFPCVSGGESF